MLKFRFDRCIYKKRKDVVLFSRSLLPHLSGLDGLKTEYLKACAGNLQKILPFSQVHTCVRIFVKDATPLVGKQFLCGISPTLSQRQRYFFLSFFLSLFVGLSTRVKCSSRGF